MPSALIVEDEPEANRLLAMLVQLRGYRTESAFTGREALTLAECRRPDLIFLDLMLPDANGFEVCRTLKADPSTAAIPVVMVTARLADENRVEGFRVGAAEYIPRPYTPDQIFQAMALADSWRAEVSDLDALSVPLVSPNLAARRDVRRALSQWFPPGQAEPDDLFTLRALGRLCSAIVDQQIPNPIHAPRLEAFVRGLSVMILDWPSPEPPNPVPYLDYRCEGDRVHLTLRNLSPLHANDPTLADLIAASSFDRVERRSGSAAVTLILDGPSTIEGQA